MLYIQIIFVILAWFEALHDRTVIELQNYQHTQYQKLNSEWHTFSAYYYSIVVCLVATIAHSLFLIIPLFLIRLTFFNLFLNIMREKPVFYLSSTGFDATMKKIFGNSAGVILFAGGISTIIIINLYHEKLLTIINGIIPFLRSSFL